jgi:hypothetical protein
MRRHDRGQSVNGRIGVFRTILVASISLLAAASVRAQSDDFAPGGAAPRDQTIRFLDRDGVVQLQQELIRAQCFAGPADGVWGQTSHEALMAFNIHSGVEMASVDPDIEALKLVQESPGMICPDRILRDGARVFDNIAQ